MSITQRSYNSINGILKKLESDPTDNTFKLSRCYIKNIITGESKNISAEPKCWDCDYDYNYILFSLDSVTDNVDDMKSLLTFRKIETSSNPVTNYAVDIQYNDELESKAIPLIDAITPLLGGLNNLMNQANYNNVKAIEDVPVADEVD